MNPTHANRCLPGLVALTLLSTVVACFPKTPLRREVDDMIATHLAVTLDAITRERLAAEATIANERQIVLAEAERLFANVMDDSFERVEVLGLVAGLLLRRPTAS